MVMGGGQARGWNDTVSWACDGAVAIDVDGERLARVSSSRYPNLGEPSVLRRLT